MSVFSMCVHIHIHIYIYMCIRMYSRTRAWTSRVNCRVPSLRMKTCVCDVTYIRMYMAIDMPFGLLVSPFLPPSDFVSSSV